MRKMCDRHIKTTMCVLCAWCSTLCCCCDTESNNPLRDCVFRWHSVISSKNFSSTWRVCEPEFECACVCVCAACKCIRAAAVTAIAAGSCI